MKKILIGLLAFGSISTFAFNDSYVEFNSKGHLRCFDGSGNSPLIILKEEINGKRELVINHKLKAIMSCEVEEQTSITCSYKSGFFNRAKTLEIYLSTLERVDDLSGNLRNYIVDGNMAGQPIICTQM